MKKRNIIIGVICVAAAAALAAVILPRFKKNDFAMPVVPPVLSAENAQMGNIRLMTDLIGTVEPESVVYLYPKASGDITATYVKAGDRVSAGQVLCEINTRQVDTAKNTMDTAEVTLKDAQTTLARMQVLYNGGSISVQSLEEYQNSVAKNQLSYDAAKINYENQVEYSRITSPISGTVEQSDIELHDTVSQSNLICVISGEGSQVVSFSVTDRIRKYLSIGDEIEVQKDGETYQGSITEINTMADSSTGLFKVKAAVDGRDQLSTGITLQLSVITEKAENAMTVPVNAVYFDGGESYVYTFDSGIIHKAAVETGIFDSEKIEVLSGITMDDMVVTTWSSELYEGAAATLKDSEAVAIEKGTDESETSPDTTEAGA